MKKQIIIGAVLLIIGLLLGFFVVVNWQLSQAITKTETALTQDAQRLDTIEKYLTATFAPKQQTNTNQ